MTYPQAKMVIWNPDSYDAKRVREAAVWILGCIGPQREDVDQATLLLIDAA